MFLEQITLELDGDGVEDVDHFTRAVAAYRQRGYGIALSGFGRSSIDLSLVRALQPDIVKFDLLLLVLTRPLAKVIDAIHDVCAGAKVAIEGPNDIQWQPLVGKTRADLFQLRQPVEPQLRDNAVQERGFGLPSERGGHPHRTRSR